MRKKSKSPRSAPLAGGNLEKRVRKLEEVSDQNARVFIDVIRHLELRVISLELVLEQLHAKDDVDVTPDGKIDWESYRQKIRAILPADGVVQADEADGTDEVQFDPEAERTEEEGDIPAGARVFSMT